MTRGRMATEPTQIPSKGWMDILARVKSQIGADKISLTSAGVAFFGLLAVFPTMTAVLAIGGLVLDRQTIIEQTSRLQGLVPSDVLTILREQATGVATSDGLGVALIVSIALALWSASRGVNVLCDGLNVVYDETEKRGLILKNAQVLLLTVAIIFGLVVCLAALVGLPIFLSYFPLGPVGDILARIGSWALLALMTIGGLALLYRYGPSRSNPRWSWVTPGAIFACIGWVAASYGFTLYVQNFASYNESFGTLAGIIIMMMWLWITVFVILLGGEINAEMEHQTRMDTTSGDPKPRGERGAVMADNVGPARSA